MLCKVFRMIQHTGEKSLFYISMHTGEEPNYRKICNIAVPVMLKGIYPMFMVTLILYRSIICFKFNIVITMNKIVKSYNHSYNVFSIYFMGIILLLILDETSQYNVDIIHLFFSSLSHWIFTYFLPKICYSIRFTIIFFNILKWIWKVSQKLYPII